MVTEYGVETNPEQSPWRQDNLSPAPDQREKELKGYLDVLLRNPQFVGAHFFQHHDQALTGRNDGEALLRGFVDAVGSPNFRLIEVNRNFAFNMYEDRFNHVVKRTGEEGSYDLKANSSLEEGTEAIGIHHYSEWVNILTNWAEVEIRRNTVGTIQLESVMMVIIRSRVTVPTGSTFKKDGRDGYSR